MSEQSETAAPARRSGGLGPRLVRLVSKGFLQAVLIVIALVWLVPTLGLALASLRSLQDNNSGGWWTVFTKPSQLTLDNYGNLLENDTIRDGFLNTIYITLPATFLVVAISALAAYAFAWLDFPGRDWLFLVVVGLLVVPIQIGLIPLAKMFGAIGIFGSVTGVVLYHVAFGLPFAIFLLRNFFAAIPASLLEAARIDGGRDWTIFFRVILPLGLPAIASLAIFQFLWVWNDLLIALIFADRGAQPLTVALQQQTRSFGSSLDVIATGSFLSLIVPLVVFFAFQRYFVQGVLAGSVK
ncbi:carbohydrate ABC transporter permease [Actinocorallia longicatena]|uniref:Carbohydrate ABC transporter permease n=1 Tax=Actinocorallia longicatena TaxID=111803 RepID=A0ABP6Q6F6_9ACTN